MGERLTGTFMWMDASRLEDGLRMHAYKHIDTRRYLFLTEGGPAFRCAPCGSFVPVRLDYALQSYRAGEQDHSGLPLYDDR